MRGAGLVDYPDDLELDIGVVQLRQPVGVGGEEELVLPSPSQEDLLHGSAGGPGHLVHGRSLGDEGQFDLHPDPGHGAQGVQRGPQPVGQVHAGRHRTGFGHGCALGHPRHGDVKALAGIVGVDPQLQRQESRRRSSDGARDGHDIPVLRSGTEHGPPAVHLAQGGAGHHPGTDLRVPSGDPGAAVLGALAHAAHDVVGGLGIQIARQCQGGQQSGGPGAHGGQVAEAHRRGVPSELLVRHPGGEVPVECDHVGGDDGPPSDDRGIVPGPDRPLLADERAEILYELSLSELPDQGHRASIVAVGISVARVPNDFRTSIIMRTEVGESS